MASTGTRKGEHDQSFFGLSPWFGNFVQTDWKGADEQAVATIPSPYLEYGIFCTTKCMQVAAFVGGCIVHPIYRIYSHRQLTPETTTNNSYSVIRNKCRKMQGRYLLWGIAAGPVVTLASVLWNDYSRTEMSEVCYRIRVDEMLVYDRATLAFALGGWYWKRFAGAVDGINLAALYTVAYFKFLKSNTNVMLVDRLHTEGAKPYATSEEGYNLRTRLTAFLYKYPAESEVTTLHRVETK